MYYKFIFLFFILLFSSRTCEGLKRDIEFNSMENYWEHDGYFCSECLQSFDFFDRKKIGAILNPMLG